jgi:hypothetical protein
MTNAKYIPAAVDLLLSVCEIQRLTSNILGALDADTALTPYLAETPTEEPERDAIGLICGAVRCSIELAKKLPPDAVKAFSQDTAESLESIPLTLESMETDARYAMDYYDHPADRLYRVLRDTKQILKTLAASLRETDTPEDPAPETDITEESAAALDFAPMFDRKQLPTALKNLSNTPFLLPLPAVLALSKGELLESFGSGDEEAESYGNFLIKCADDLDDLADRMHEIANTARARLYVSLVSMK